MREACGVLNGEDIYTFGGQSVSPAPKAHFKVFATNELWKLNQNTNDNFKWTRILVKDKRKTPSSRMGHSGWEYDGKVWTFGGWGPSVKGYLNYHGRFSSITKHNNQLLNFNPENNKWTNIKCFGTVPSPRSSHATTALENKVWLYGGTDFGTQFEDLYELDMRSLTWRLIQTTTPKPASRYDSSLNVTRD